MNQLQQEEFRNNFNILVIGYKFKALQATLSSEQLVIYNQSIEESKELIRKSLEKSLSFEQVDELLKAFDN